MRRHHAVPSGLSGHYQDLGISSLKLRDSACNVILSVVLWTEQGTPNETTDNRLVDSDNEFDNPLGARKLTSLGNDRASKEHGPRYPAT